MKETKKSLLTLAAILGVSLGLARQCNVSLNTRTISTPTYTAIHMPVNYLGHAEYTRFSDGSQDVKYYHPFNHKMFESEFHQDLNGDGLVDTIRTNGGKWMMNSLGNFLVRTQDYTAFKEEFDEADVKHKAFMEKIIN